jgi:hypothetical protein
MPKRSAQDARDTGALSRDERKNQHIMKLFERQKKLEQRREDKKKHAVSSRLLPPTPFFCHCLTCKGTFRFRSVVVYFKSTD